MFSGCASEPTPLNKAQFVPPEKVYLKQELPVEGNATAVFVRDGAGVGDTLNFHIFIDGKKAASLDLGEKVEFVLPAGEHIFGVIPTNPFGVHTLNTIDQELKSGRRYFYRVYMDAISYRTVIQRFIPPVE